MRKLSEIALRLRDQDRIDGRLDGGMGIDQESLDCKKGVKGLIRFYCVRDLA